MKKYIYVALLFSVAFGIWYLVSHNVSSTELWSEKIDVKEGGYIEVYHSHRCTRGKPLFIDKCEKIEFIKRKHTAFDICIDEKEAKVLNTISKYNINEVIENGWLFVGDEVSPNEIIRFEKEICDKSSRDDFSTNYSWVGVGMLKLQRPVHPFVLLDDMGRKCRLR